MNWIDSIANTETKSDKKGVKGEEIESEPRPSTCEAKWFCQHYRVLETRS